MVTEDQLYDCDSQANASLDNSSSIDIEEAVKNWRENFTRMKANEKCWRTSNSAGKDNAIIFLFNVRSYSNEDGDWLSLYSLGTLNVQGVQAFWLWVV